MGKFLDIVKGMSKHHKLMILAVICVIIAFYTGYLHHIAPEIGQNIGATTGNVVGLAIGSADGLMNGLSEGSNDGAEAGLSAEDTNAEIKGMFEEVGKLEVMSAGVTLKNIMEIDEAYKDLKIMKATAVYTIDLSKAHISKFENNSGYVISIPQPKMELYLDVNSTQTLASIQNTSWTVDAEDGLKGYLNSLTQMKDHIDDAISNYEEIEQMAKETGIIQVKQLVKLFSADGPVIEVIYQEGDVE